MSFGEELRVAANEKRDSDEKIRKDAEIQRRQEIADEVERRWPDFLESVKRKAAAAAANGRYEITATTYELGGVEKQLGWRLWEWAKDNGMYVRNDHYGYDEGGYGGTYYVYLRWDKP